MLAGSIEVSSGMRPPQNGFRMRSWRKKYLITFLIKKFNHAENPMLFSSQMEEKLRSLTEEQVKEIMNPKTEEDVSREQATYDMLEKYLG